MISRSRELEAALGDGIKRVEGNELKTAIVQQRALYLIRDLPKGHILISDDIEVLRPAPEGSLKPYDINTVLGQYAQHPLKKGQLLLSSDIGGKDNVTR
jgi:N-acetylneuraminate synthase